MGSLRLCFVPVTLLMIDCVGIAATSCGKTSFPLEPVQPAICHWSAGYRTFRAGPVAQWLEPAAHNRLVGGSSPSGPTNLHKSLILNDNFQLDFPAYTAKDTAAYTFEPE